MGDRVVEVAEMGFHGRLRAGEVSLIVQESYHSCRAQPPCRR